MNTKERTESRPIQDSSENTNNNNYPSNIDVIHNSEQTELLYIKNNGLNIIREKDLFYVLIGNKRLSEVPLNTIQEAIEDSERTDIKRLLQLIGAVTELTLELKAKLTKENE